MSSGSFNINISCNIDLKKIIEKKGIDINFNGSAKALVGITKDKTTIYTYKDGSTKTASVVEKAITNNYGEGSVPPRPFMTDAFTDLQNKEFEINNYNKEEINNLFNKICNETKDKIKKNIMSDKYVPLSKSTKKEKRQITNLKANPKDTLRASYDLYNSIDIEVENNDFN